jgi:hypothetical protein
MFHSTETPSRVFTVLAVFWAAYTVTSSIVLHRAMEPASRGLLLILGIAALALFGATFAVVRNRRPPSATPVQAKQRLS